PLIRSSLSELVQFLLECAVRPRQHRRCAAHVPACAGMTNLRGSDEFAGMAGFKILGLYYWRQ
ncbi:hypothetical protein, partial [Coxiella burnetii]